MGRVLEIGRAPSKYVTKSQFQKTVRSSKGIVVVIVGPGGVGKTKLAQDFFESNRSNYSRSCFLSDAKESSGISLQRRVIKDLTKADVQIDTIAEGKHELKMRLLNNTYIIIRNENPNENKNSEINYRKWRKLTY